jgi:hypothetical protein
MFNHRHTKITRGFILFALMMLVQACGSSEAPQEFQQNEPAGFQLTKVTEGYGAVDDAYNSVDAHAFNDHLANVVDGTDTEFEVAQYATSDILGDLNAPVAAMVRTDTAGLLDRLIDPRPWHFEKRGVDSFYSLSSQKYTEDFYAFLDRMSGDGYEAPADYLSGLVHKVVLQTFERMERSGQGKVWLNTKAADIIEDLQDPLFQQDYIIATKLMNKLLLQGDYPVYLGSDNLPCNYADIFAGPGRCASITKLGLGHAAQGTHDLIVWFNRLIHNTQTRGLVHDMLLGFDSVLDPAPEAKLALKTRTLMENLRDNFTTNGATYNANPVYSEDSNARYSDAELSQTIREASTLIQQLFTRSDRPQSMITTGSGQTPVYPLDLMNANLRSIGFDPDTIDVERSIDDLMRHDIWGRDRVTDLNAYPVSHLESLLFLTQATANHGWRDSGTIGGATPPQYEDSRVTHRHGDYTEELTLNDSLFSIRMIRRSGTFGVYEMAFSPTNGNHLYRTRTPFTVSQINDLNDGGVADDSGDATADADYRFFYDRDYGVLQFLAGPGPGDLGAPEGGNSSGQSLGLNQYRAHAPNGLRETQLAAWTMGWGVRACFKGEGPYYYADPNAESVSVNGQAYRKYLRPDGKIYALVRTDGAQYLYPTNDGDAPDTDPETPLINGQPQRDNRYKASWHSDYYVGHYSHDVTSGRPPVVISSENRYFTVDNSSGKTEIRQITDPSETAGRLVYRELVAEDDPMRACASPEEAFFRNYQWVMNEKKMVLVIPMYMETGGIKGVVFEIQECNGYSGLANLRRFRANHVWAKQGTDGTTAAGNSTIPGDYRFEVVSAPDDRQEMNLGAEVIYNDNIDCGNGTPSVVGHNLPALYRLAFPLSAEVSRAEGVTDRILGSKEFSVGDTDWQKRNAFVPILYSLLAGLREYSPEYDPDNRTAGINAGIRAFMNQTAIWIKPLFYYNRANQGGADQKAPYDSWTPRVHGIYDTNGDGIDDRPTHEYFYVHQGAPFLTSSADFHAQYDELLLDSRGTPPYYYGDEAEQRFYQPAAMKTILNVLIDSDITSADHQNQRCNGLLPLLTASPAKPLSRFFKLFLNPEVSAPPLEQIFTAMKFTKGPLTQINEDSTAKGMNFPEWMFLKDDSGAVIARDEDIDLDEILDKVIYDELFGLARDRTDQDWDNFSDNVQTLAELLHEDSPYCISQNALELMDRVFARDDLYTSEEIKGFLYAMGKLFGYYDAAQGRWIYQGESEFDDLYNMLALRVPDMNSLVVKNEVDPLAVTAAGGAANGFYGWGDHYYAQMTFLREAATTGGLVEYLLNTMSCPQDWETTLSDLNRFIGTCPDVAGPQGRLWPTVSQLLRDMGKAVGETRDSGHVGDVLSEYGFQVN